MDFIMLAPIASILALLFATFLAWKVLKEDEGPEDMQEISWAIRNAAAAYLKREYIWVTVFFVAMGIILGLMSFAGYLSIYVLLAFLRGGFFSAMAGYIGMWIATRASARTTIAAKHSLNKGLRVAFSSGSVMGLTVVGLALLDVSAWYYTLKFLGQDSQTIGETMLLFGIGASSMALFARVGGGIYTKGADVGADLVGKVEAGIPEDDPRNPAVIADNVGDNVGDVAGMGADLYESYMGSLVATIGLGSAAAIAVGADITPFLALPMVVAAMGIFASMIGTFFVRTKEKAEQKELLWSLRKGIYGAAVLAIIFNFFSVWYILGKDYIGMWGSIVTGTVVGVIIGYTTEYFTSDNYRPTRTISESALTGHATVMIRGLSVGMMSTVIPVLSVAIGSLISFFLAGGSLNTPQMGLYGIGLSAVGMLSTLGITLATDAYGPVADNAGGIAEMTHQPSYVRERTDALDALGNTTAATGKGFAIGSAALTALALISGFMDEIRRFGMSNRSADYASVISTYHIDLLNPLLIAGVFIGAMIPFVFCSLTMGAVGRAAQKIVEEVRRQFREIPGLLEGKKGVKPHYERVVDISTRAALKEMVIPALIAIIAPLTVGYFMGVSALIGLLIGSLGSGFVLAVFMANAGAAWDNAKKYIEKGNYGGKGSEAHKAAVTGDTVGDPFKDTSGPSLNILLKLMSMVSLVFGQLIIAMALVHP